MRELQVVFRTHLNFVVIIDIENRLMDAKWEGRDAIDWEFGSCRCKLSYTDWINNIPISGTPSLPLEVSGLIKELSISF